MHSTARADSCRSTGFSLASSPDRACRALASMAPRLPSGCPQREQRHFRAGMLCVRRRRVFTMNSMMLPFRARTIESSNMSRFARLSSSTGVSLGVGIPLSRVAVSSSALTIITTTLPSATFCTTSSRPSMLCVKICRVLPAASRTSALSRSSSISASDSAHPLEHTALRPCRMVEKRPSTSAAPRLTVGSLSANSSLSSCTFLSAFSPVTVSPTTVWSYIASFSFWMLACLSSRMASSESFWTASSGSWTSRCSTPIVFATPCLP
mmetsp:Transcript_4696/g.10779  ORF Transcript_4696/g.10779 Transcript_4696/m.10779 type:complete len:266 (-) Transcript_4696:302-1099(-)